MKKILLVNDYLHNYWWAEKVLFDMQRWLIKRGYEVKIFWGKKNFFSIFSRFFSLRYAISIFWKMFFFRPDIVHLHWISRNLSISILPVIGIFNVKVFMTAHDLHYYCPKTWWINEKNRECKIGINWKCWILNCHTHRMGKINIPYHLLKYAKVKVHKFFIGKYVNHFFCPSTALVEKYKIAFPEFWELNSISYLPNFVETVNDKTLNLQNNERDSFLYIWRLSLEKWVIVAIRAIERLVNKWLSPYLTIVGKWLESENLKSYVKNHNLQNYITFEWRVDNSELYKFYEKSAAVLMPSVRFENNPIVGIEALRHWKILICSNFWGFIDLVNPWKNWYLFERWSVDELSQYMKKVMELEWEDILTMGQKSFDIYKNKFTESSFFSNLENIYNT